jgi:hypothetical protein
MEIEVAKCRVKVSKKSNQCLLAFNTPPAPPYNDFNRSSKFVAVLGSSISETAKHLDPASFKEAPTW